MRQKVVYTFIFTYFLLCFTQSLHAQWSKTTCPFGGEIRSLLSQDNYLYAGTWGGGIFRSSDNGVTWSAANTGLKDSSAFSLFFSGTTLFAGTQYDGVYVSKGSGNHWFPTGLTKIEVEGLNAIGTHLFAGTEQGMFVSTDGGSHWNKADTGLPASPYIHALAVIDTAVYSAGDNGLFAVSPNNGTNWILSNYGLPAGLDLLCLGMTKNYLFTGTDGGGGVFRSRDKGSSWHSVTLNLNPQADAVGAFTNYGINLFAGTSFGEIFLTTNDGDSWVNVSTGLPRQRITFVLAVNGSKLFAGTDGGLWSRPLSDFGVSSVSGPITSNSSLTSFPNPVNGSTTIRFSSPDPSFTQVSIMNLLGAEVARLFSGELEGGEHSFTWDARGMPAGMYECVIRMNAHTEHVPIVVLR